MRLNDLKATVKTAVIAATILLLAASTAVAQSSVTLTATRQTTTLPDGKTVPMWGLVCGSVTAATCTAPNGQAQAGWQPPVITVPYSGSSTSLSIVLNNALPVETSLVIVGQLAGNLGTPTREASPRSHPMQTTTTWPANGGATFTPPDQAKRARSFVQEVAAGTTNTAPTYTWSSLRPGTYLIETGTYPSIQGPMGLYGVLVVTTAPVVTADNPPAIATPGTAYTVGTAGVNYDADAVLLLSEIDPVQNAAADAAAQSASFDETKKWTPACGAPPAGNNTCYPPAVNYAPMYYLVNGVSFDQSAVGASTRQLLTAASTGNVLLRFVNAGLRMHVPSVVGLNMALIAEDGNVHPDVALALTKGLTPKPKTQNEVFLPAGKVFDVMVNPAQNAGSYTGAAFPIFDRALGTSEGSVRHGSGMLSYLEMGTAPGSGAGSLPVGITAQAIPDSFNVPFNATTFAGNVLANDVGISNAGQAAPCAAASTAPQTFNTANGNSVTLNPDGSFTLTVTASVAGDTFSYCGNGNSSVTAIVTFNNTAANTVVANNDSYTSSVATLFHVGAPGVLGNDTDSKDYPLNAAFPPAGGAVTAVTPNPDGSTSATFNNNLRVTLFPNGSFTAIPTAAGPFTFSYFASNSQGVKSASAATVNMTFLAGSGLSVKVVDTQTGAELTDYRWVIERDMTYHSTPGVTTPPPQQTLATSFHRSYMPVVASGCTGAISCESGQTVYNPATGSHDTVDAHPISLPSQVNLPLTDTTGVQCTGLGVPVGCNTNYGNPNYYYISVLPGDAANPVVNGYSGPPSACQLGATHPELINPSDPNAPAVDPSNCGHEMGGSPILSPIAAGQTTFAPVTVTVQPNPLPPAQLSIFVYEDNNPTNGDVDGVEEQQGLGGFQIILNDIAGSTGMPTGQMTYDMFNMPLTNSLIGTPGCPDSNLNTSGTPGDSNSLVGMIITCPNPPVRVRPRRSSFPAGNPGTQQFLQALAAYNARVAQDVIDYALAGHALIKNLFPNRFDVLVTPSAAREAAGEQWLQTSTLEGTHANDAFAKLGEPAYFQEFGSPGVHSFVGFVNIAHIDAANKALRGTKHTISGTVTNLHMSRPWNMALYDSGSHDPLAATNCYVGLNSANGTGENVAFAPCDGNGGFVLPGVPDGQYQLVVWDQWQDQILEYQNVNVAGADVAPRDYPVFSWFQQINTRTYLDNGADNPGLNQVSVAIRFRDGQFAYQSATDNNGYAGFPETFPLFNWYVVETDTTRFKGTKVNIINDSGAAVDAGSKSYGTESGFSTDIGTGGVLNSTEMFSPLPASLQVPGATYVPGTTVRHDPGSTIFEGFQAFISEPQFVEFGKTPYAAGENGGISGHVAYASTRPFDDPQQIFQNLWAPLVPGVTVNLYQENKAADGTTALTLIDSTTTTSWDAWVNGTHPDPTNPSVQVPNMNCPGQDTADPYYNFTLGSANRYKCYDGFHNWNQMEPAPYDGAYQFPTANCKKQVGTTGPGCVPNSVTAAPVAPGPSPQPLEQWSQYILAPGKYVTEVILPPGFDVVKEEDKNILIGDTYIAPAISQFAGLGNIFILPDQAMLDANLNAPINADGIPNNGSTDMGRTTTTTFGPGGLMVQNVPCVGQMRIVPDFLSLFTDAQQIAPFAGASRHLCDRKEVTLEDQMQAKADFFIFTPTPKASKFTGMILDDLSAEFNTSAPDFGEKFAVPFLPVSFRDFNGIEVNRIYADQFGTYNGLVYSTFDVNPPNPTGYAPNMMITCMNDPGPITDHRVGSKTFGQSITDPMYNPQYSNFCYTLPFMPGTTAYLDTPVLPTAAFAAGYNPVDCAYPDATPAIARVDGSDAQFGPWLSAGGSGKTLTITALGDVSVPNNAYAGPSTSSSGLANQATITRHYGFGGQCTSLTATCKAVSTVKLGNTTLGIQSWTDAQIVATVPAAAATGELSIIAGNGKTSVDTVTVTIETKVPTYVNPPAPTAGTPEGLAHPIQDAIDAARPGALIILNGGVTASVSAPNTPCGSKLTPASTNCLPSAANYPELVIMWKPVRLQGVGAPSVIINATKYPTQKLELWRNRINTLFGLDSAGNTLPGTPQADPLPGQEITGGIVLLEPSVLGTEEGAGITVTSKNIPDRNGRHQCSAPPATDSNFLCAPSRIDGVSITGGDAGGGIYVNGWAHNLEIANNRVYGNAGTFTGGVRIGQPYLEGQSGLGPFGYDANVKVHHNSITENGTVEANNGQGGAGGGLSMCSGTDNYHVNYNFICGNFALGDGGGVGHIGLSWNGDISNNWILFNQTFNQSSTTSGGGLAIEGEPSTTGTLSLGSGNVSVDSNLIQGNDAEGGLGAGVRLQDVNGNDVDTNSNSPNLWWKVSLTNNIIVNNVAGWAGGGISLYNTANSQIVNNTVTSNDATATAGPVIALNATPNVPSTHSDSQPAGIVTEAHSAALRSAFGNGVSSSLTRFSNPLLENNIIWRNRSFHINISGSGANPGTPATIALIPALAAPASAGACPSGAAYWDLGVLGDASVTSHPIGRLNPTYSVLTSTAGYSGTGNTANDPLVNMYCNGPRVNPGIPDSTPPNPDFRFQVAGAEDEGGNWVNLRFGPLSLSDPAAYSVPGAVLPVLGDYRVTTGSSAVDHGSSQLAPNHDFFGGSRPQGAGFDIGAHELAGAIVPPVMSASLTPTSWTIAQTRNCPGTTLAQVIACALDPAQAFTLTNTGNVPLTGVGTGVLGGTSTNVANYAIVPGALFSTCGNSTHTTLAPGATCTVTVQFKPRTAQSTGLKPATISVTDSAGTQTSALNGTAQ